MARRFKHDTVRPDTCAVRGGEYRSEHSEHSEALYLTSSFVFDSCQQGEERMAQGQPGNVYSRYTNPTVRAFEQRLAALEGAEDGVATSSGMAAILTLCMTFLRQGDHIICSRDVFGSTRVLLTQYIARFGVEISFVPLTDMAAWTREIRPTTRMLFLETPSNPMSEIADIRQMADLAHQQGARLVVDNCFCTPILQQPLKHGADLVMHTATKYIDGQGRALGGAIVGSADDTAELLGFVRSCGPALSPFNAWIFLKGLETLRVRMQAHFESARHLARWLGEHSLVEQVFYAGLDTHPGHALALTQQSGFNGVLSFRVTGGREQAWALIDATELMSITPNLGDTKTTIIHPATTTHGRLTDDERAEAGITENLVRISVGLEDVDDLKEDLLRAFDTLS